MYTYITLWITDHDEYVPNYKPTSLSKPTSKLKLFKK